MAMRARWSAVLPLGIEGATRPDVEVCAFNGGMFTAKGAGLVELFPGLGLGLFALKALQAVAFLLIALALELQGLELFQAGGRLWHGCCWYWWWLLLVGDRQAVPLLGLLGLLLKMLVDFEERSKEQSAKQKAVMP